MKFLYSNFLYFRTCSLSSLLLSAGGLETLEEINKERGVKNALQPRIILLTLCS